MYESTLYICCAIGHYTITVQEYIIQLIIMQEYNIMYLLGGWGPTPFFPQDTPKFGFGDGQKWGKKSI